MGTMKRILVSLVLSATFLGLVGAGVHTVRAATEANEVITDQQIAAIRTRCGDIQATLNRVHESDKVLRVNKGYRYKAVMLDKLMTPLNQRVAANQIDGGKLVTITAAYSKAFGEFDKAYSVYERSLSAAIKTDCGKQPTAFYDQILVAYENRKKLQKADTELIDLSKEFNAEVSKVFGDSKKESTK